VLDHPYFRDFRDPSDEPCSDSPMLLRTGPGIPLAEWKIHIETIVSAFIPRVVQDEDD